MSRPSYETRKKAYHRGLRAEQYARWWLRLKGYKLLAERYKNAFGEIDIIARKGCVLALVEVKARASVRECLECITPHMQARQIKAAKALLAYPGALGAHIRDAELVVRFDVICVVPRRLPKHITSAWMER